MIKNYLKIAFRNIWKNKFFTFINVSGLTIGLASCMLMVLYLRHELSYDKFQEKGDRIVRVIMEYSFSNGTPSKGNFTSTKVLPSFMRNFEEVEDGVRMDKIKRLIKSGESIFEEPDFLYADSSFFKMFSSFKLLIGKPDEVLSQPATVVLSKSAAEKYFKNYEEAVGKTLQIGSDQRPYLITGVSVDPPSNSQIKYDFIASFPTLGTIQERTYWNANYTTYLLLKDKHLIASLQEKIRPFMEKEMAGEENTINYELEPYTKVHLFSPFSGFEPNNSITYVYIIAGITLLLLVIACFTYINISTARSIERSREVGVRKVAGAFGIQIFRQFITESLVITFISFVLSLLMVTLFLHRFNDFTGLRLNPSDFLDGNTLGIYLFMVGVIAFLAGAYPAMVLSRFQPIKVLKGAFKNSGSGAVLQKSLISFQFVISIFLIISTLVTGSQLRYIQNKNLGYDRSHVMVMQVDGKVREKIDLFKSMLKANNKVLNVSTAYNSPVEIGGEYNLYRGDASENQSVGTKANPVDEEFVKTNSIEIIAGEDLNEQDVRDATTGDEQSRTNKFLLNEQAVKVLGWTAEEAVGKHVFLGSERPGIIKGVIRDFHFASLHNPIEPLVLFPEGWRTTAMIKIASENMPQTIAFISEKFKELAPYRPFEYRFMDEDFDQLYKSEQKTAQIFGLFSAIAILLACLGLFAVSAYSASQRIKEIGIRKTLGASLSSIALLLSANFLRLALLAMLIAFPLAWWAMDKWLEDFAYRITFGWEIFAIAGMATVGLTLLTVSFHAIKAGLSNPVIALKSE
ncbi:MAG: ABC transporter permease [Saprospiraceae bacterium]|nr:ABC transporter permease [Saprospiraceae bacterium]